MGKFSIPVPRIETTFHPDLIQDISAQLSSGRQVLIIYDESQIPRQRASSILKKYQQMMFTKFYFCPRGILIYKEQKIQN